MTKFKGDVQAYKVSAGVVVFVCLFCVVTVTSFYQSLIVSNIKMRP